MEYITFMHGNKDSDSSKEEWDEFFNLASKSGYFRGGSAIGKRSIVGEKAVPDITSHIGGFMRFEVENLNDLVELLGKHPTVLHGGTVEICEMPKT